MPILSGIADRDSFQRPDKNEPDRIIFRNDVDAFHLAFADGQLVAVLANGKDSLRDRPDFLSIERARRGTGLGEDCSLLIGDKLF